MKPAPATKLQKGTPWEWLDRAFRTVLSVPKEVLLKQEAKSKRARARKKLAKRNA